MQLNRFLTISFTLGSSIENSRDSRLTFMVCDSRRPKVADAIWWTALCKNASHDPARRQIAHCAHSLPQAPESGCNRRSRSWDDRAKPMLDYFLAFQESFNRFPGFNYEVQGVFQERVDGRIKFHTYVVRE